MNVNYLESRIRERMCHVDKIRREIYRFERRVALLDRVHDRDEYRKFRASIRKMYRIVDEHNRALYYLREMLREVVCLSIPAIHIRDDENTD